MQLFDKSHWYVCFDMAYVVSVSYRLVASHSVRLIVRCWQISCAEIIELYYKHQVLTIMPCWHVKAVWPKNLDDRKQTDVILP